MIKIRTKTEPDVVKTYASRKEILDLERWGLILEIVHDDENPTPAQNTSGKPEKVLTEEQLKQLKQKASPESDSGDEQE